MGDRRVDVRGGRLRRGCRLGEVRGGLRYANPIPHHIQRGYYGERKGVDPHTLLSSSEKVAQAAAERLKRQNGRPPPGFPQRPRFAGGSGDQQFTGSGRGSGRESVPGLTNAPNTRPDGIAGIADRSRALGFGGGFGGAPPMRRATPFGVDPSGMSARGRIAGIGGMSRGYRSGPAGASGMMTGRGRLGGPLGNRRGGWRGTSVNPGVRRGR